MLKKLQATEGKTTNKDTQTDGRTDRETKHADI